MKTCTLFLAFLVSTLHAQVFTFADSIQYSQAGIWGVVSDDGDSLVTTTTFTPGTKPHIYLRKGDYTNIINQGSPIQLTFDSDFAGISNLTDHKSLVLNNELYVSFSTQGDSDLFIFKTDLEGNRIGSIVSVVQNQTDPTNDMILVTDSTYLYVLHFDPVNQHHVYTFDTNLNPIGSSFSTTTLPHNNIGNALLHNNEFYMLTGDFFGFNADLVLTRWDTGWTPTIASPQTILASSGGDGNWFPTGMIWDEQNQRWYVGMSHINPTDVINEEHIDLLAFDASFNLLERIHLTDQGYYRPHFVLKNDYLYVSYDKPGSGVYLHKYQVANTVGMEEPEDPARFFAYPNPANDMLNIHTYLQDELILTDMAGKIIMTMVSINEIETMDLSGLNPGIYFLRNQNGPSIKIVKR
jgi:hypothetical protein